ncbi:MAG: hypothetical protein H6Q70_4378 [Firmicutes bacterium]|nr:hypothetical protein [Bacillota bacterium]
MLKEYERKVTNLSKKANICFVFRMKDRGYKYEYDFKFFHCDRLVFESNFDDDCKDYCIFTEKIHWSYEIKINVVMICKKKRRKNGKAEDGLYVPRMWL